MYFIMQVSIIQCSQSRDEQRRKLEIKIIKQKNKWMQTHKLSNVFCRPVLAELLFCVLFLPLCCLPWCESPGLCHTGWLVVLFLLKKAKGDKMLIYRIANKNTASDCGALILNLISSRKRIWTHLTVSEIKCVSRLNVWLHCVYHNFVHLLSLNE